MTTLLLLSLAGAAAAAPELVSVLEAFNGPADALDIFGAPAPLSPGRLVPRGDVLVLGAQRPLVDVLRDEPRFGEVS
jgi:hypothetical protein